MFPAINAPVEAGKDRKMSDGQFIKRATLDHWSDRDQEQRDRIKELEAERDEALNQLDSARHSIGVLEKRVAELKGQTNA